MNINVNFRKSIGVKFLFLLVILFFVVSCEDTETGNKCKNVNCSTWQECNEDTGKCILSKGRCNEKSDCSGDNQCVGNSCVDPCAEVTCSNHGTCEIINDVVECNCEGNYQQSEDKKDCVLDVCTDIDCSGHGNCVDFLNAPLCNCDTGYTRGDDKVSCTEDTVDCNPACGDWQDCNDSQECVNKEGFCTVTTDCVGEEICNDTTHKCEVPSTCNPACDDSWQMCNDSQECVAKTGFCTSINDCIGEEICNDTTHKCEVPSTCNPACDDSWQVCSNSACIPKDTFCDATTDCGDGNICDETIHKCIASCTPVCDGKACGDNGCNGSCGDCADGTVCNDSFQCEAASDPCTGVECNNGVCEVDGTDAVCLCESAYSGDFCDTCSNGYHPFEENCVKTIPMGAIIITEFMADPAITTDNKAEWIEIYNTTDESIDLAELKVYKNTTKYNVTFTNNSIIASHEYMLIARSAEALLPTYDATASFSLTQGGADLSIVLNDMVLDVVTYTSSESGKSWQLDPSYYDYDLNNDADAWCLGSSVISDTNSDLGTPRLENIACP